MSTRNLKKVQKLNILLSNKNESEEINEIVNSDSCQHTDNSVNSKHIKEVGIENIYSLLNEDITQFSDRETDNENIDNKEHGNDNVHEEKKQKWKQKRNNKNKKFKIAHTDANDKEIEMLMLEMSQKYNYEACKEAVHICPANRKNIFIIQRKYLEPENELKNLFGSKVVRNVLRNKMKKNIKKYWLAQPKDDWPPLVKHGLSMVLEEKKGGISYFTFVHNHHYQKVQFQFMNAVRSLQPELIGDILKDNPYHIDALLQMSEIFKIGEEINMARQLIERVLFSMESAFHPLFSLTSGQCRLLYYRQETRGLFIALFKHMIFLGQRGCPRTALEFAKLLFNLDPENDPLAILLIIDLFALRANEYDFLIEFYKFWETEKCLFQLPNFAFSVALAYFYKGNQNSSKDAEQFTEEANAFLKKSLTAFPGMIIPLFEKCNFQPHNLIASYSVFTNEVTKSHPVPLRQLINLYIEQCHHLWKEQNILLWLEENALNLIEKSGVENIFDTQAHKKIYKAMPREIQRHILLCEVQEAMGAITNSQENFVSLSFDPLPPEDSKCGYQLPKPNSINQEENMVSLLLRSILPNYVLSSPTFIQNVEVNNGDIHSNEGRTNNLQESITTLVSVMRDLLSNIRGVNSEEQ